MRFLMKQTSYHSAIVSAGEPRDDAKLPVRYELPHDCNPLEKGHHLGVFKMSDNGGFDELVAQKEISQTAHQGFEELEFIPIDNTSYCLVYATDVDIANSAIASFQFTTRATG